MITGRLTQHTVNKVNKYLNDQAEAKSQLLSHNEKIPLNKAREEVFSQLRKDIRKIEDKALGHKYIHVV